MVSLLASVRIVNSGTPGPADCRDVFNPVRCQVMTDYVARQLGTTRQQVAGLRVVPETIDGELILDTYTGGPPVHVEVTLRDGSVHRVTLHCGGIPGNECRVARLDIPIDHTGLNEIPIGEARLPNGILAAADFALVEAWPAGVSILDGVSLEIRSLDDGGTPIRNIFDHGWRPGTERVQAVLVFDVMGFDPGATLGIRDVDVR